MGSQASVASGNEEDLFSVGNESFNYDPTSSIMGPPSRPAPRLTSVKEPDSHKKHQQLQVTLQSIRDDPTKSNDEKFHLIKEPTDRVADIVTDLRKPIECVMNTQLMSECVIITNDVVKNRDNY